MIQLDGQVRELDMRVQMRGRVVNNVDPKMEGRLGVFIPSLMTDLPDSLEAPAPFANSIPGGIFENQDEMGLSSSVREDSYIWARPCAGLVENGQGGSNQGGSFRVPRNGTVVSVYFEGGDPNRPYWLPHTPTVDGDVVAGTNLGKGLNLGATAANWTDPTKRVNVHVLAEYDNGNVIAVDNNPDANSLVVRWANGHTLSVGHAEESGIVLQTERGHLVQLDENSGEIRIRTQTGQSSIVIDDGGNVTVKCASDVLVEAGGGVAVKAGGGISLTAPSIRMGA